MGDVISRRLFRYDMTSILLVILLFLDFVFLVSLHYSDRDEENDVRIDINRLISKLNQEKEEVSINMLREVPYPICIVDEQGIVLISDVEKYKTNSQVDLSTLGGETYYLAPIIKKEDFKGLLLVDMSAYRSYVRRQNILLKLIVPTLLCVLLIIQMVLRKRTLKMDFLSPVSEIHNSTKGILKGDFEQAVDYDYEGEIGLLCHDFEKMRDEIHDAKIREKQSWEKERVLYASLSHDLKTPLSIISGYLEQIQLGVISEKKEMESVIDQIIVKTKVINKLIDDILEHSKAQLNQLSIQKKEVYADEYFQSILKEYEEESKKLHYHITYETPPVLELEIDPDRIGQVVQNIIGNAVKYTDKELFISVAFEIISTEDGRILVTSIEDNGSGIEAADIPFVFDLFYRGNKARTQSVTGSGMGLNISKYIVEKHGGRIECDSISGVGTTISFSIPII